MQHCAFCGSESQDDARFCRQCGQALSAISPAPSLLGLAPVSTAPKRVMGPVPRWFLIVLVVVVTAGLLLALAPSHPPVSSINPARLHHFVCCTISEFPIPSSGTPIDITAGPDGNLWFTEYNEFGKYRIGRVTPSGTITEFPGSGHPYGITAGPDGNLWFTEEVNGTVGKIGRITTAGVITGEFTIPRLSGISGGTPDSIIAGPDGNLWFTVECPGCGRIGRINPTTLKFAGYTITPSGLPTASGDPIAITVGPDGNLWFTEYYGGIGRITPSGTITEFSIPSFGTIQGMPSGITTGPDGNLWFTESKENYDTHLEGVGRINPKTHVITECPKPIGPSQSYAAITTGPDGNLWFNLGGEIGRITPSCTITTYPAGSSLGGITIGPDGNLWFTEGNRKIGQIS